MRNRDRNLVFLTIVMLASLARAENPEAKDRIDPLPEQLKSVGQAERLNAQVPLDLDFIDGDGTLVTLKQFFDGNLPVILTLNYSRCPRLCSLQLNGLVEGLQKLDYDLGQKYRMVTVSIDPTEAPARAQATKEKYLAVYNRPNVEDGWHFLVGREENIRKLAKTVGFGYAYVPETKEYAHEAVTIVCTPDGRVSRYLYGIEYDPKTLRLSLLEAAEGKIGTTVDHIILYCFAYDAKAGSYSLAAVKLMRIGGLLTLALLGGVLLLFWRRELKKSHPATERVES